MTRLNGIDSASSRSKNAAMLLQEAFGKCGLKVRSFEDELECDESTISGWAGGFARANPRIFDIIEKRGKFLSKVNLDRHDFDWVCNTFGIKVTLIADKLGITQQALSKTKRNLSPERRREIEKILHGIGQRLVTLARKAA